MSQNYRREIITHNQFCFNVKPNIKYSLDLNQFLRTHNGEAHFKVFSLV